MKKNKQNNDNKQKTNHFKIKKHFNKLKLKKQVLIPLIIIIILIVGFSSFKIYKWYKDNKATQDILNSLETVQVFDVALDSGEQLVNPPDDENDTYWNFVSVPLMDMDFTSLLARNNETVAYIKINNTVIDYPVVQHSDNDYYLTHDFDKNYNGGGWVFSDYRNRFENLKHNTIIYAHGRKNGTMFGGLKEVVKDNWFESHLDTVIYISTPNYNSLWQIVSVYTIPTELYYLTTNFGTDASHQTYIDTIMSRSMYDFGTKVDLNDHLLTLSTCLNDDIKIVVHAKMIKVQYK